MLRIALVMILTLILFLAIILLLAVLYLSTVRSDIKDYAKMDPMP